MKFQKSNLRVKAETVMEEAGYTVDPTHVWVDRSTTGRRVKFFTRKPSPETLSQLRQSFANQYPHNDTRVWFVEPDRTCQFCGIAFKVFDS
jgi:hypothetical protein